MEAVKEAGAPGQRALVVRRAGAGVVDGAAAVAGELVAQPQTKSTLVSGIGENSLVDNLEDRYVARDPQNL